MKVFTKITTFLKEVRLEMKKVNWPSRQETVRKTLVVIGISVAIAIFLGAIDFVLTTLLNRFILR
ncbi:MAG: preprotein translocase subunit SecE [Candidatus Nealsonbacteria bacterium CG18_big_fil_WC_8_21_14_2_50_37_10]|uniref:Protein translocase subunit SecE n=1 Tax=Candidatus Nealsonbacteria bacterium CG18_big_fil_WC_8_21_14_2_50_37_10 TaxID=1974717 RepID=A0A2H0FIY8_9BACT|nr:MAG: preprotein translocase subunit SecE [Candidatus Nealsonbacteria bacterium CG18_big_fil_WC_8_21_14_2_50_37_10]